MEEIVHPPEIELHIKSETIEKKPPTGIFLTHDVFCEYEKETDTYVIWWTPKKTWPSDEIGSTS